MGPAQLNAFRTSIKRSQKTHVTIHDVKCKYLMKTKRAVRSQGLFLKQGYLCAIIVTVVAVSLLQKDEFPIPVCFLSLLK